VFPYHIYYQLLLLQYLYHLHVVVTHLPIFLPSQMIHVILSSILLLHLRLHGNIREPRHRIFIDLLYPKLLTLPSFLYSVILILSQHSMHLLMTTHYLEIHFLRILMSLMSYLLYLTPIIQSCRMGWNCSSLLIKIIYQTIYYIYFVNK
jgi:hypothetical protein